jgi:hypothetical protein
MNPTVFFCAYLVFVHTSFSSSPDQMHMSEQLKAQFIPCAGQASSATTMCNSEDELAHGTCLLETSACIAQISQLPKGKTT